MCIINSCQPDIKICFFSVLPTSSLRARQPTGTAHVLLLSYGSFSELLGGQLFREAVVCLLRERHHLPTGMEGRLNVGSSQAAVQDWVFPGGGEGFRTDIRAAAAAEGES